ncbi:MAG: tetratricopeptide repeat protein [Caldimicrobium sp.]
MKKYFALLCLITPLLGGCVASSDEFNTFKIKLLNLETLTQQQEVQLSALEKRINEVEKRLDEVEKKVSQEIAQKFLQSQSKILADIEETRKEVATLQGKIDEMTFQQEGERKSQIKTIEDLKARIEALELRIKELEKANTEKSSNQTSQEQTQTPSQMEKPTPLKEQETQKTENTTISSFSKETLSEEDLYQRAYSLYSKGDLKGARSLWELYLTRFPKGKWVGQTYFYIGETYFREKDYESAILSYQKLIEMPGPNPLKPKAMLRQADAFLALKDKRAAQVLYKKIIQTYPASPEAKEAEKKLKGMR